MTGLDNHNLNLIENSFKREFKNLTENSKSNIEKVEPEIFTKVCISLLWSMKV